MSTMLKPPVCVPSDDGGCATCRAATDNGWMMMHAFKILAMQTGFAVLESSFVRSKNSANIMMKNMVDLSMGTLGWWAVGYALAYGNDKTSSLFGNPFVGTGEFFTIGTEDFAFWFFQLAFAATAATIGSGAIAERMNFKPYVLCSMWMTCWIYPIGVHWCWSEQGWLRSLGFFDYAGSGVVHMVGGMSALFMSWYIGPRHGRFGNKGELVIKVEQAENLQRSDRSYIQPYVSVKQLSHGQDQQSTRHAENSTHPRWGTKLSFDVNQHNPERGADFDAFHKEGLIKLRWTGQDQRADHWHFRRASEENTAMHSDFLSLQQVKKHSELLEVHHLIIWEKSLQIRKQRNARDFVEIKFSLIDRVEKRNTSYEGTGFSMQLLDLRTIEFQPETREEQDEWLEKLFQAWRPTMIPMRFLVWVQDAYQDVLIGDAQMELSGQDKPDPMKFAIKRILSLRQGGRVELSCLFTSAERLEREIFQACDPTKLLFGTFVLWMNWYSFNVGSTMGITDGKVELGARIAVRTTLSACAGALLGMIWSDIRTGYILVEPTCTGILAGLVSISACCATVTEAESVAIGVIGAMLTLGSLVLEEKLKIDDPCSAFSIHGVAGAWGIIAAGLFASPDRCVGLAVHGAFRGGGGYQLGVQLLGVVVLSAWSIVNVALLLFLMGYLSRNFKVFTFLTIRPTLAREKLGADHCEHNIHLPSNADDVFKMNLTVEEDPVRVDRDTELRGPESELFSRRAMDARAKSIKDILEIQRAIERARDHGMLGAEDMLSGHASPHPMMSGEVTPHPMMLSKQASPRMQSGDGSPPVFPDKGPPVESMEANLKISASPGPIDVDNSVVAPSVSSATLPATTADACDISIQGIESASSTAQLKSVKYL